MELASLKSFSAWSNFYTLDYFGGITMMISGNLIYVTGFMKTDHNVTFCISRNTILKH